MPSLPPYNRPPGDGSLYPVPIASDLGYGALPGYPGNPTPPSSQVQRYLAFLVQKWWFFLLTLFFFVGLSVAAIARISFQCFTSKVPVVGVTETEPQGKTYQDWMIGQLDAVARALSDPPQ